jgi:hypothetical protein
MVEVVVDSVDSEVVESMVESVDSVVESVVVERGVNNSEVTTMGSTVLVKGNGVVSTMMELAGMV